MGYNIEKCGKDNDDNLFLDIVKDDTDETLAARVFITPHDDFVVEKFIPNNDDLSEMIKQAKDTLQKNKHMPIEKSILQLVRDEQAVFEVNEEFIEVTQRNKRPCLEVQMDTSIDITSFLAEEILWQSEIDALLKEYDTDTIADAIDCGAMLIVKLRYYTDYYTDELSLETAKEKSDETVKDCLMIVIEEYYGQTDVEFIPDNQKWFKDFLNEQLAEKCKWQKDPTARNLVMQSAKMKEINGYEKE